MIQLNIREPIWKTRSIGIRDSLKFQGEIAIKIAYKDKAGNKVYPGTYLIKGDKLRDYPIQKVRGLSLRIVPIRELEVYGEVHREVQQADKGVGV